jgi:hypothetical protein
MSDMYESSDEIDRHIADARDNLRQLLEQAAAFSGAADDERVEQRIAEQQKRLDLLLQQRATLDR